ncbi:hypothetical protein EC957_001617 [Mortierella hygrophila]|uniref:Septation initiation network scaffold protein cdc11 n=1 Tax=Mortierella hygrophila TaxID=979708 RepID=A0A9P6FGJ7_9FUNG|nr:hypothetical protein EC957_001617 [Mortierella hygrophila]
MLRAPLPRPSTATTNRHQKQSTPIKRSSPVAVSPTLTESSISSSKEQRQQQLQLLQRQQKLGEVRYVRGQVVATENDYRQYGQEYEQDQDQEQETMWASQETKDAWIKVAEDADADRQTVRWERRQSHLSDKHMNLGPMRLLSDETPPDVMDGSWDLDSIDDNQAREPHTDDHTTTTINHFNEQNDRNITKNNENTHHKNNSTTNNNNEKHNTPSHGYAHMGKEKSASAVNGRTSGQSQRSGRQTTSPRPSRSRSAAQDPENGQSDGDHNSSTSFVSTYIRKSPASDRIISQNDNVNRPWRDSKLHGIFIDLLDDQTQKEQLADHGPIAAQPQSVEDSFGDLHDALHNDRDLSSNGAVRTPSRQAKYEKAKQSIAALSPSRDLQDNPEDIPSPSSDSAASLLFKRTQEAFLKQKRQAIIKAAMTIDPNDDRSLPPKAEKNQLSIKTALAPSRTPSNIPPSSRSSRVSYGSRHRSQGSKDTEIGDRGSTTSRDSVYRDSLSGSTLGSAGFQAQLEGINKHELAHVFSALKTGAVAELFATDAVSSKKSINRILPDNVNSKSHATTGLLSVTGMATPEDTDMTPQPTERTTSLTMRSGSANATNRRIDGESDPARTKQITALSQKGLSKQSSSFVEDLANATDIALRSGSEMSFKNTSSPPSKKIERSLATGSGLGQVSEQTEGADPDEPLDDRRKREVKFTPSSATSPVNTNGQDRYEEDLSDKEANIEFDMDDLDSLAGSRGMENAFKSLENFNFDTSFETMGDAKENRTTSRKSSSSRQPQTDDEGAGSDFLSAVSLPSKPRRRGEHSLKWENQIDTASNADSSRYGPNTSFSRSSSNPNLNQGMMAEQSSFSHAEGELIRYITGLHPWDEWDQVKSLDLTKREVESTIRLNHLVPNLEVLILNENQVPYLTGVPKSVKTLQVRSNLLSDLTNFSHLANLQYLDISHNAIEDLTGLSSLVHLRELIAEGNNIKSVSALQQMDGLIRLDVSHNNLTSLDFRWSKLQRLEFLNASHNKIEQLENLESLAGLIHANLAHNCIEDISLVQPLRRLRILRLSENKLLTFNADSFPGLRTLYLDDNRLQSLENCQTLTRLENFSARDQQGEGIAIDMTEFINSRKLYLSGNPIHALDFEMGFYRLEYLEICAGCLSELPIDFAALFPNLRGLNLSYNGLDSLAALDGLHRLRRLIFVGNSLKSFSDVLSLVKRMRSLVTLDLRHNPLTSNMYPAMSIRQGSKYQDTYRTNQNSETELDWRRRDVGFRRSLPDSMYVKRSVYRSAILKSCKRLEWFDGGAIQVKERERAPMVLGDLLDNYGRNYLAHGRREDDEEDFEYEDEQGYRYEDDYYQQQQQHYESEWIEQRAQLEQLNQESLHDGDEEDEFDANERDPEDITDNSKRQSSLDSGSMSGQQLGRQRQLRQVVPKSPLSRFTIPAMPPTPHRLRSQSGYSMASPSPKEQQVSKQRSSAIPTPTKLKSSTSSLRRQAAAAEEAEEDGVVVDYEGSSDKRSAVQNWRDEVNEVSQRKLMSPRGLAATTAAAATAPVALRTKVLMSRGSDKDSHSSHSNGSGSSRGSRNGGGTSGLRQETLETSTGAVGQRSSDDRPAQERRTSRRILSIPPPTPGMSASWSRPAMHARRRSDGAAGLIPAVFQQQQQQAHRFASPSPMTASGTLLRPNHLRRRSFGVYPHHNASAGARKKEMLGLDQSQLTQSPAFGAMSVGQLPTPGSPGYFGMSQHYSASPVMLHSPYGSGKVPLQGHGTPSGGAARSIPNTPSRAGGRLSRVSQGTHHYPQTLARDMERSVIVD